LFAPIGYFAYLRIVIRPFRDYNCERPKWRNRSFFTISATWDNDASVWTGHCDDIPAAADAPTLDELLAKISSMTLDLLPDNHPGVDPASVYLQITALREVESVAA